MNKPYDYTINPTNSPEVFKRTCSLIEASFPGMKKDELLIDVDGSTIQIFGEEDHEIIVYDDYDIGAVIVKSDVDLSDVINGPQTGTRKIRSIESYSDIPAAAQA